MSKLENSIKNFIRLYLQLQVSTGLQSCTRFSSLANSRNFSLWQENVLHPMTQLSMTCHDMQFWVKKCQNLEQKYLKKSKKLSEKEDFTEGLFSLKQSPQQKDIFTAGKLWTDKLNLSVFDRKLQFHQCRDDVQKELAYLISVVMPKTLKLLQFLIHAVFKGELLEENKGMCINTSFSLRNTCHPSLIGPSLIQSDGPSHFPSISSSHFSSNSPSNFPSLAFSNFFAKDSSEFPSIPSSIHASADVFHDDPFHAKNNTLAIDTFNGKLLIPEITASHVMDCSRNILQRLDTLTLLK